MNTLQKYEKYLYLILFIGIVIYFPIFFNGFVWDDFGFIINNPQVHQLNLPVLFGKSLFNSGSFYRPIPAVYFAIVYSLAGQHALLYHLIQLILHLADSLLLFLFFCLFFSEGIALFLALLFLVHPINVESVAFIGSTQSELYFLPGIIALFLSQTKNITFRRLFWITGLLLLSSLAKETGFLFIFLVITSRYLFRLGEVKKFLSSGASIVFVYGILRLLLGGVLVVPYESIPIANLSLLQRLLNIPAIVFYYLKTFVFPMTLTIFQTWTVTSLSFQNFVLPLFAILLVAGVITYFALSLAKKPDSQQFEQKKQKHQNRYLLDRKISIQEFLFFAFWFVIGMGIILQIVPLDMTVADRWFYFPIVGLLGIIGVVLQVFLPAIRHHYKTYLYAAIIIICLLSVRTFSRAFDWKNQLTLYADAHHADNNYKLDDNYALMLFNAGKQDEAITYVKKSIVIYPTITNGYLLGYFYKKFDQPAKAISAYNQALTYYREPTETDVITMKGFINKTDADLDNTYKGLAYEYIITNDQVDAINLILNKALKKFPNDAGLYVDLAIAYINIGNHQQALNAISKAYSLNQSQNTIILYNKIKNNQPLNAQ